MMVTLSTILIAAMAIGLLIVLSLILTMWIRGRKREIGILSSLGIKKQAILAQFILESLPGGRGCISAGRSARKAGDRRDGEWFGKISERNDWRSAL